MRARLCTLALAAVVLGCGDSSSPKSIAGSYPLVSVDGHSVPTIAIQETGYTLEVLSGNVTINANGTFADTYTIRETLNATTFPPATIACNGTWTRSGNDLILEETATNVCGDYGSATWDGNNTITIDWQSLGVPVVHRR
ncbi:MAG TPA: hypothetical protein VHM30_17785 [Gemmatimonadaceae bacterium]|nr:hypothetical protein [Gemmatimonadaceae bacterium]